MLGAAALTAFGLFSTAPADAERYTPPPAFLEGYARVFKLDVALRMHVAVELVPKDRSLDATAEAIADPASPMHHLRLSEAAFAQRYGRSQAEVDRLGGWLRASGATNVYVARNRLVVGGDLTVPDAERAFSIKYDLWQNGDRTIVAPIGPLTIPIDGVRAVRGAVKAYTPRLADTVERPSLPSDFRGMWYGPSRFREAYDAIPNGGAEMRIALIEDSSDQADPRDLTPFSQGTSSGLEGGPLPQATAPPAEPLGLDPAHVIERVITPAINEQLCGRDDHGQEATIDVDAAFALAPAATVDVRYDEVCVRGAEGTLEIQRALDDDPQPDVIVFPFAVAPLWGPSAAAIGPTPIAYLEATLRGIAVVVPSGDDGAYGIHVAGFERPGVTYPCVLPFVICVGGTALGERNGRLDEGPWNDGLHASGGGIAFDPRPTWQHAPMEFSLAHAVVNRMVPDVSADAAGHLYVAWHGYNEGGVGGTSESAAIVGAELAAIDAALPPERRITTPGDLYALASAHPQAFRDVVGPNDRGYADNALRPRPAPLPLGFRGVIPSPPPPVRGCLTVRPRGCDVDKGYDLVTGLGSLLERAAVAALGTP